MCRCAYPSIRSQTELLVMLSDAIWLHATSEREKEKGRVESVDQDVLPSDVCTETPNLMFDAETTLTDESQNRSKMFSVLHLPQITRQEAHLSSHSLTARSLTFSQKFKYVLALFSSGTKPASNDAKPILAQLLLFRMNHSWASLILTPAQVTGGNENNASMPETWRMPWARDKLILNCSTSKEISRAVSRLFIRETIEDLTVPIRRQHHWRRHLQHRHHSMHLEVACPTKCSQEPFIGRTWRFVNGSEGITAVNFRRAREMNELDGDMTIRSYLFLVRVAVVVVVVSLYQ